MGRFHFNIRNGTGETRDDEGQELPGPDEAHSKAVEGARSLLSAEVLTGEVDLTGRIEVTDDRGSIVEIVEFRDVLHVKNELPPATG